MLDISRLRSLVPCVRENDIAITVLPGDFFIAKLYALKVIMLLFCCVFGVVHDGRNADNLHTFK